MLAPWKKSYDQPRQHIKKQRHYFANKGPSSQSYGFSSSHGWMWELDHKKCLGPKNFESHLDCKEIKRVNPKGNQSWICTGRTDAEAESPTLWPPGTKNWFIWKDPDAGKIEGRRRRGRQKMRWLDDFTDLMDINLRKLRELVVDREAWPATVHGVAKYWIRLSDWTDWMNLQKYHYNIRQRRAEVTFTL